MTDLVLTSFYTQKIVQKGIISLFCITVIFLSATSFYNTLLLSPHTLEEGFEGPFIIRNGGIYEGKWESKDSEVPAIEIRTKEPVIIKNSTIRSAGPLIRSIGFSADITIVNTKGYGTTPTPYSDYKKPRRFLAVDNFKNIIVENCYLENTAGIYLGQLYEGNNTKQQTIKIRYNEVKNIDGRVYGGLSIAQFVQFNFRNSIEHVEIAWNQVINEPDKSAVEDNINIYNSRGTAASPILIHDNYIQGAFPFPSTLPNYSGGGIITDSPGADSLTATAHLKIFNNQLVGLGNYCFGIAGGNHIEIFNNRAIVAAKFSDSTPYKCWTSGIWAKDYYKLGSTYSNKMFNNVLATVGQNGSWRNEIMDSTFLAAETFNNLILPEKVTLELEKEELIIWQSKLASNNINVGIQ